jgi:hypothetical protein
VKTSDRLAVRVGSTLSIFLAVWGLAFVAFPFGSIGGAVAAAFGLVLGVLALASQAWGRWRTTAITGIVISSLALLIFAVLIAFFG